MGVLNKIRDWLTGKSSTSTSSTKKKKKKANTVSNYGGGVATSRKEYTPEVKREIKRAKEKEDARVEKLTNEVNSAFKAKTPPSQMQSENEPNTKQPPKPKYEVDKAFKAKTLPKTNKEKLQEQMQANIEARKNALPKTDAVSSTAKPKPPTIKHRSTALGTLSESDTKSRLAKMNVEKLQQKERNRAADKLKPLIDAKYGGNSKEVKQRIKSGDYAADPDVAKYETLKHPNMASFGRGALSGTTFGLSELAIAKLPQSEERKEAERLYQANKSKGMETLGELAGSLASFGTTSAATDKLGGKLISKVAPNAATRLAEKQFIKNAAGRLVERGVETNVIGGASEELIKQVGKDKATKIVGALGNDIVQNLTTGAIYDVNKASDQYDVGSKEWWKELGKSALFNFAVTGGIAGGTAVTGGKNLVENAANTVAERADMRSLLRPAGNIEPQRITPKIGESIEDRIARIDAERLGATADDAASSKSILPETRQLNLEEEINNAKPKIDIKPKTETPTVDVPNAKKAKSEPRVAKNVEDFVGKSRQNVTRREKIKEFTKSVRTKLSDSLNAFEDEARKKTRDEMLLDYGAIDKVRRYKTVANRSITEAQIKWDGNRYEDGKSLAQIFGGMDDKTEKSFNAYLLLRHAPDRIREGKPIFDNMRLENGLDLNNADDCLKEAERLLKEHPEFAEKAEEVYKYTRNELQNRVDAGLLPQEVADEWNQKYPFYVPTGREGYFNGVHGDTSRVTGAGELKAAKGSDYDIWDIKQQLSDATTRNWRDMSMNNMFRRMFGDRVASDLAGEADGGLEKVLDNTINLSKSKEHGRYYANVYIDGELKRVEIEKRFYDGIEDMYKNGRLGNGIDVLNDAASVPAGLFKNLITEYSPIFMIKNFMRDFPEAVINTRQTKEFFECMPAATKDLLTGGEFSQALRDAGISQSTFIDFDKALKGGGKKGVFALGNEYTELYPRLIEYMATIKKAGYDLKNGIKDVPMEIRDMAAANAADVTVNFGRSGSVGKMLNRGFVPFFNPSVQGWSKFGRNLSELKNASAKERLSFAIKATALGAGATAINNYALQNNQNYQMISARDKANNYIFPIGDPDTTDKFIKIPSSRFAAVYGLPTVNLFNENKMGWAEAIKVANDQVAPIDPLESNIFSQALQVKNNTTWYGTPIVPKALEDLPKSEQYDVNTSSIGKALGKATENLPKELQISPKKADYAIDSLTGVAGDFLLPATTPSKQGKGLKNTMLNTAKRQFTIDTATQNNLSSRFYDQLQEANSRSQSSKGTQADKDEYKRLSGYSTELAGINKAIQKLQGSKSAERFDKIRGLQKIRNQMMQDAIDGKDVPSEYKTMDAVQKYVGTSYAVNNFGSSADKRAMKLYGEKKYGDLSAAERRKAINADKDFYKGVQSIGKLQDSMKKAGIDSDTTLTRSIALASINADDALFGAYKGTSQSRTESANEMERARTYFKDGGSEKEYVKLEKARKTLGKLPEEQRKEELKKLDEEFAKGKMSFEEYDKREADINYNADTSYIGLATSFAQANAPKRGYTVYDIKDKNIQKGINLAAMGYTARDYRKMSKELDADGNGYPKKQEIIDYINNGDFKDKATLFNVLYYYQGKSNPFGAVTNYTREQAAAQGKAKGVEWITDESDEFEVKEESGGSGNSGYYRRRWGRWHRWGRGSGAAKAPSTKVSSAFKAKGKPNVSVKKVAPPSSRVSTKSASGTSSSGYGASGGSSRTSRTSSKIDTSKRMNISELNIKTVKPPTSKSKKTNLSAALEDIQKTQKKVAPPKARKGK